MSPERKLMLRELSKFGAVRGDELDEALDALEAAEARSQAHHDQLATIVDEAFGLQPVSTADELLTLLERKLHNDRSALREALRRADAAEARAPEQAAPSQAPHPLDALRAYVAEWTKNDDAFINGNYSVSQADARRNHGIGMRRLMAEAERALPAAFAAVERELAEARATIHNQGRTIANVSRNYAHDVEEARAQGEADRAALRGLVDLYRKSKESAAWPEVAHRQDRLRAAIEATEARLAGAPPPVAPKRCHCNFEPGDSPCPAHDCPHGESPADCALCNHYVDATGETFAKALAADPSLGDGAAPPSERPPLTINNPPPLEKLLTFVGSTLPGGIVDECRDDLESLRADRAALRALVVAMNAEHRRQPNGLTLGGLAALRVAEERIYPGRCGATAASGDGAAAEGSEGK